MLNNDYLVQYDGTHADDLLYLQDVQTEDEKPSKNG